MKNPMPTFVLATLTLGLFAACSGGPPTNPDAEISELSPCPDSPNCVSTTATDETHAIDALPFAGTMEETMAAVVSVVEGTVRTRIITRLEHYLHAEYRTRIGFVDDVEFLLDSESTTLHFRSASRLGYGDLGVNRERMEEFSTRYRELL